MRGRRPNGWSRIGNFHISCTRVRTKADWRPDGDIWTTILALFMSASRRETTSSVRCNNLPISELGKNLKLIDQWWTSGRAAERSGWSQAGTEASRYSGGSERKDTSFGWMMLVCLASGLYDASSGRMEQWRDGRPDGITRRPDGWQGVWNLLSFSQCRVFWKYSDKWNLCLQHLYT
jgi:hypothetical protein